MGLAVLGPDVNESLKGFSVNKESVVRFGLNAIKGVGEAAVEDIIKEREENGTYINVFDFIKRVNQRTVNKKTLEGLVLAGAMDSFKDMHRAQYFYAPPTDPLSGLERLVRFGNQFQSTNSMASNSLFGESVMPEVKAPAIPTCDAWSLPDLLEREKEVVGIYLSAHPLDGYRFEMDNYSITPVSEIESKKGRLIRIAGFVTDATHMTTKKGSKFGKLVLNDYSGHHEIVLWETNYVQYGNYLSNGQKLMITGTYQEHKYRPGVMEFNLNGIMLLDHVRKTLTKRLLLVIPLEKIDAGLVNFLQNNVKSHPGNTELLLQVTDTLSGMTARLKSFNMKLELNDELVHFLQSNEDVKYSLEIA
jgi:DNA polymerase-3 subunit alpha